MWFVKKYKENLEILINSPRFTVPIDYYKKRCNKIAFQMQLCNILHVWAEVFLESLLVSLVNPCSWIPLDEPGDVSQFSSLIPCWLFFQDPVLDEAPSLEDIVEYFHGYVTSMYFHG